MELAKDFSCFTDTFNSSEFRWETDFDAGLGTSCCCRSITIGGSSMTSRVVTLADYFGLSDLDLEVC